MTEFFAKEPVSKYQAPQKVEVVLDPNHDHPGTVRINGTPIDNIAAIGVETMVGDMCTTMITLKLHVPSDVFKLEVERVKPSTAETKNAAEEAAALVKSTPWTIP